MKYTQYNIQRNGFFSFHLTKLKATSAICNGISLLFFCLSTLFRFLHFCLPGFFIILYSILRIYACVLCSLIFTTQSDGYVQLKN